jgi:ABC-type multidrug transport system fused ATPase/permease subunit
VTIEAGQTVAFVGVSGCGKSTLLSLVQKLYNPGSGSIKIDGVDISTMSTSYMRSQIAVVPQEPKLFNMSVARNISCVPLLFRTHTRAHTRTSTRTLTHV